VTLVDTGDVSQTGGRLRRVREHVDGTFCFTYGDGLSDVDVGALLRFHEQSGTRATVTTVQPPGRFGSLEIEAERVTGFREKPRGDGGWISGGFFVLEPEVIDLIPGDASIWEREPMERLAADGQLSAYRHDGFWHAMDTLRDRTVLEELWESGRAPWRTW
jgi:glucose-1-phosphate cytidylyltransferase